MKPKFRIHPLQLYIEINKKQYIYIVRMWFPIYHEIGAKSAKPSKAKFKCDLISWADFFSTDCAGTSNYRHPAIEIEWVSKEIFTKFNDFAEVDSPDEIWQKNQDYRHFPANKKCHYAVKP